MWSGWLGMIQRPPTPKIGILPTELHPDIYPKTFLQMKKINDILPNQWIYEIFYWNKVERLIDILLFFVGSVGYDPTTSWLWVNCANQIAPQALNNIQDNKSMQKILIHNMK